MHTASRCRRARRGRPPATTRQAAAASARGGRRRHRLHRPGAAAAAGRGIPRCGSRCDLLRHGGTALRSCRRSPIWDGAITPLASRRAGATTRISCSWRCPTRRPPSSRPSLVDAACASSICRARSGCATRPAARGGIRRPRRPEGARLRPHRARARTAFGPHGWWPIRAVTRRRRCSRWRRWPKPAAGRRRRRHRRRQVGRVGRGQDAVRADAFLGSATAACRRTACSAIATAPRSSRVCEEPARVTFTPHLVPLDRGILATIYVRVAPGTTEEALGDMYARAYGNETFVRLVGRRAAGDQARRAHELLRHRLARRPVGPRHPRLGHRQPAEGRVRPGRAEHERHARRSTRPTGLL